MEKVDDLKISLLIHAMFIQIVLLSFKEKYYFTQEKGNPPFSLKLLEVMFRTLERAFGLNTVKYQCQL